MPKILEKDALILRNNIGTASNDGIEYELTTGMSGHMLVKSEKTGRTYVMDWQAVIEMAIAAGVNEDPQPANRKAA